MRLDLHNSGRRPMSHPSHELVYVVRGRYRVQAGEGILEAGPGEMVYLPQGLAHSAVCRRDGSVQVFLLWFADDRFGTQPWLLRDSNGRLLMLLHWLRDRSPISSERDRLLQRCLLQAALCDIEDLRGDALADRDPLRQAMEFLRHNHPHPINLGELCGIVGLGRTELTRRFRVATGLPPMAWLQRLRAGRALDLLVGGHQPLRAIAQAVGFRSAEHLSRLLRREFGRPPSELRQKRQER
jgi:AraC-like DNA-binding protein